MGPCMDQGKDISSHKMGRRSSLWKGVDGASRGMRAEAGGNSESRRDLNVSFLEPRCENLSRLLLHRMSLFFILLVQLCWHLGNRLLN